MNTSQHRRSIRLPQYDYAQAGAYFVTMLVHDRQPLLGEILADHVKVSAAGKIVQQCWTDLPRHYANMETLAFVIMPDHVHGLILLKEDQGPRVKLGEIIRAFKSFSARRINLMRNSQGRPVWHRNYYEHIIRTEAEMDQIFTYIEDNPRRWSEDEEERLRCW